MDRREFSAAMAALALMATQAGAQATTASEAHPASQDTADLAVSRVYRFQDMPVTPNSNGGWGRQILHGTLPTGEFVEAHETMLPPGKMPHPPHRHRNTEFLLIREGSLEYLNDGVAEPVGPGDVIFTASNRLHGLRNIGTVPALYFVVSISHGQL